MEKTLIRIDRVARPLNVGEMRVLDVDILEDDFTLGATTTLRWKLDNVMKQLGSGWGIAKMETEMEMRSGRHVIEGVLHKVPEMPAALNVHIEIHTRDQNMPIEEFVDVLASHALLATRVRQSVQFSIGQPAPKAKAYLPTPVTCEMCGAEFPHTELIDNVKEAEGEAFGYGSKQTCPKCGAPDCCEIEFEKER